MTQYVHRLVGTHSLNCVTADAHADAGTTCAIIFTKDGSTIHTPASSHVRMVIHIT